MITKITGKLTHVAEDEVTLEVGQLQYQVLVPESVRRRLQQQVGEQVSLHTIEFLEGNPMQGRLIPRLVGFLSDIEREFFDQFCSVDGVGVRKALRAMVRPVREIAEAIHGQDKKALSALPGVGESTAERIIAKLRKKVAKFALIADREAAEPAAEAEPDVIEDAFAALTSVGHSEAEARRLIDKALAAKRKYKTAADVLDEIYRQMRPS